MASVNINGSILCKRRTIPLVGNSSLPFLQPRSRDIQSSMNEGFIRQSLFRKETTPFPRNASHNMRAKKEIVTVPRSSPSNSTGSTEESSDQIKVPFGYSRKDVLLIGLGVTIAGYGLKTGLEFIGVDPLQAGNVVQLVLVLGLTVGWISTYIFRVSNKEMTYAQQLRDYEDKVMQKRLEGLTEAELEALLEQVEEEKRRVTSGEQIN
ncbi:unnamed protein product [Ilex paraguariensis]|uniref:MAR-binding filament-like protein 1-1 n=1 Tax=Ilex paraguariensis TaxID=185542 RepID=A0ABC8SN63_9AQUA